MMMLQVDKHGCQVLVHDMQRTLPWTNKQKKATTGCATHRASQISSKCHNMIHGTETLLLQKRNSFAGLFFDVFSLMITYVAILHDANATRDTCLYCYKKQGTNKNIVFALAKRTF